MYIVSSKVVTSNFRSNLFIFSSFNFRSASFVEFVQLCLKKQPAERPTAEDLLQVSYWSVIKYVS